MKKPIRGIHESLWNFLEIVGTALEIFGVFGYGRVVFENPRTSRLKIGSLSNDDDAAEDDA